MESELVELSMYRDAIKMLLKSRSPRIIQNNSIAFAKIIVEEFIRSATEAVYIYSTRLDEVAWGALNVLAAVDVAIDNGVVFHVLTRGEPNVDHPFLKRLRAAFPSMGSTKSKKDIPDDFMVVDGVAFRLELEGSERKAVACAYSPANAQALISVFRRLLEES